MDSGTGEDLVGLAGSGPDDVWALTKSGGLRRWDGVAWRPVPAPAGWVNYSIAGVAGRGRVWLHDRSYLGDLYRLEGMTWEKSSLPDAQKVLGLWTVGREVFALGEQGYIYRHREGAWQVWLLVPIPPARLGIAYGRSAEDVWVTDRESGAEVLRFDGTRWSKVRLGSKAPISGFHGVGKDLWAFRRDTSILHYQDP
jgi:hypothetical protein